MPAKTNDNRLILAKSLSEQVEMSRSWMLCYYLIRKLWSEPKCQRCNNRWLCRDPKYFPTAMHIKLMSTMMVLSVVKTIAMPYIRTSFLRFWGSILLSISVGEDCETLDRESEQMKCLPINKTLPRLIRPGPTTNMLQSPRWRHPKYMTSFGILHIGHSR